ncbi:MAG: uncharacterized protein QOI80_895, partial [Solirubrobacteraceae bacterium]|nr:uncharacterized protein [Solirubrobacteraceae bacterium]
MLVATVGVLGLAAGPAQASTAKCNVAITASDGTVLRANLWLPDGDGPFPTVLTVSGYNKDATNPTGQACSGSGGLATADTSLADKGYAVMLVDERGTGASQGNWDSWGRRTQRDYRDILDWIQARKWSNGSVATTGGSYMGITSLLVAEADAVRVRQGKPRAVKAVWADIPMSDAYRDVTFHGGAVDAGFIPLWLGLTTSLSDLPPSTLLGDPGALTTYAEHLRNGYDFAARKIVNTSLGAEDAYDGPFFRLRSPGDRAAQIRVPVVIQGGWWDIFQRGEPLLYEQLTHSPHKKLIMSPHYHVSDGPAHEDPDLKQKWFERWLMGKANGAAHAPAVSFFPINGTEWQHPADWPVPGVRYRRYYLGDGGGLAPKRPAQAAGDSMTMLPASSPCSRLTTQWTAGAAAGPCESDNNSFEATGLTYTTDPVDRDTQLTGPIVADIRAAMTTTDATLIGVVSDVAPDGTSSQLSAGFLLASQRRLDRSRSTFAGKV